MITEELQSAIDKLGNVNKNDYTICISKQDFKELLSEQPKTNVKTKFKKYMGFNLMSISIIEYGDIYITKLKPSEIREQLKANEKV